MNTKKAENLSNEDRLMFMDFMEWVNTIGVFATSYFSIVCE